MAQVQRRQVVEHYEDRLLGHLAGDVMRCFAGKATTDEMRASHRIATLTMRCRALWKEMGASSVLPTDVTEEEQARWSKAALHFMRCSSELVDELAKLSDCTTLLDDTHCWALAGVYETYAERIMAHNNLPQA